MHIPQRISQDMPGNYLVRVRAQVMMRDDSTGGWLPMGGGGLSNVSVRKRVTQPDLDDSKHEYLIYGKRLSDQSVVLSCTIKKDFEYNKVMPTFHHWKTGDKKFGLTFQTAADARAFDKGVRMAVEDLLEGLNDFPSYRHGLNVDVGDDNVFMAVNLPVDRDGSRTNSSGSVTTCGSSRHTPTATPLPTPDHPPHYPYHHHHHHHYPPPGGGVGGIGSAGGTAISTTNTSPSSTISNLAITTVGMQPQSHSHSHANHLHRITFPSRPRPPLPQNNNPLDKPLDLDGDHKAGSPPDMPQDQDKIEVTGDTYSYVQCTMHHEYSYPVVEGIKAEKRDSIASLKKQQQLELAGATHPQPCPPTNHGKRPRKRDRRGRKFIKARCRHCQETFTYDKNSRGSCEYAPDCVRTAIDTLTCISCAHGMLYHCMSDAEGDFAHRPCECGGPGGTTDELCGRRWLGLTLLSLLVPCLWCYIPLRACHRCAVACRLCGGRHEAS
ncbi:sprouty-related, EVH1 domain-containing protein 2-like isoform X2 [Penaeus monodon]|uniref:sprouty-related, EVH1 domain-containing protein 2-like isoform X2 n=1 Tax=Penaeus monodon TaxID=6687 RepID=UPI0018A7CD48|nr:sprouty-related, EVH1 domain-containing protein 2-like isoform X2 [Penaeus monodon]